MKHQTQQNQMPHPDTRCNAGGGPPGHPRVATQPQRSGRYSLHAAAQAAGIRLTRRMLHLMQLCSLGSAWRRRAAVSAATSLRPGPGRPAARPRRRSRARTSARYIRAPVPVANRTRRRAAAVPPGIAGMHAHEDLVVCDRGPGDLGEPEHVFGGGAVVVLDDRRHRPRSGRPGRRRGHRAAPAGSARSAGWLTVMRRPRITSHNASRNSPMNVTVETWVQEPPETNWPILS